MLQNRRIEMQRPGFQHKIQRGAQTRHASETELHSLI
jgi:hypothetical protein